MLDTATMQIRHTGEGHAELELAGDLNVFCATQLHEEALRLAEPGVDVLVCAEQLTGVDAAALQILVALKTALTRQGHELRFRGLSAEVLETVRLADLDACLQVPLQIPQGCESTPTPSAT